MNPEPEAAKPSRKWLGWLRDILLALILVFAFQWWQARDMVQGVAPKISARLVDGSPIESDQYAGKPLLVHFWATWCPVCKLEDGAIGDLAEDFQVITIATGSGNAEEVSAYMKKARLSFPVLLDEDGSLGQEWGIKGVPASFVLDGGGNVRSVAIGYTTEIGLRLRLWLADWSMSNPDS